MGGLLAYEASMKIGASFGNSAVPPLVLMPEPLTCSLGAEAMQPWFRIWPLVVRCYLLGCSHHWPCRSHWTV